MVHKRCLVCVARMCANTAALERIIQSGTAIKRVGTHLPSSLLDNTDVYAILRLHYTTENRCVWKLRDKIACRCRAYFD